MLFGVGQHWVRRWWFLSTRPNRASLIPRTVEAVLDSAVKQNAEIKIVGLSSPPQVVLGRRSGSSMSSRAVAPVEPQAETVLSLSDPHFPSASAVPILEMTGQSEEALPPARPRSEVPVSRGELRVVSARERHWMSKTPRTPRPPAADVPSELSAPSIAPPERPSAPAAALSEPPASAGSMPARAAAPERAPALPVQPFPPAFSARPITPAASVARSRRSGRPSSAAPSARAAAPAPSAGPARAPSVRPVAPLASARPSGRSPSVRPVAAVPSAPPVAPAALNATEQMPPPESRSSLVPVPGPAAVGEVPESGWRELLDDHGTASGW